MERFSNDAATTLNGGIDDNDLSLVVTSATGFPTAGDFRIRIGDELLVVTGVSGTTWTVTRGAESTTAASHADLAAVTHVLTAASLVAPVGEHEADTSSVHGITDTSQIALRNAENEFTEHNAVGDGATVDQDLLAVDGVTPFATLTVFNAYEVLTSLSPAINLGFRGDVTFDPASAAAGSFVWAGDFVARIKNANTRAVGLLAGLDGFAIHGGTGVLGTGYGAKAAIESISTGTITTATGLLANVLNDSTGTITTSRGIYSKTGNAAAGGTITTNHVGLFESVNAGTIVTDYGLYLNVGNTGTITTHYGLRIASPAGTITNNYGLYLNDHSGAGGTLSYNLYSVGATAKNLFEGTVQVDGALIIPRSTSAAPTAEGSVAWDSDDDALKIGTGAGTKTMSDTTHTHAGGVSVNRLFKVGNYYPGGAYGDSGVAMTLDELHLIPFECGETQPFDQIICSVTAGGTAGAVVRMGVWTSDADGRPGTLVSGSEGTIDSTGTGYKAYTFASPSSLAAGLYWLGMVPQVATCSLRASNIGLGEPRWISSTGTYDLRAIAYVDTAVSGALPSPPVIAGTETQAPICFLRAS